MEPGDVLQARVLAPALAGVAMAALGVAFYALDVESRLHRAFGLFLVLRGLANLGSGLIWIPDTKAYWTAVTPYFGIALPFAALYFGAVYRQWFAGVPRRRWILRATLLAAATLEFWYLTDHMTWSARDAQGSVVFGPLFLLVGLLYIFYAILAHRMTKDYFAAAPGQRRASLLYTALAFAFTPVHVGGYSLLTLFLPSGAPGAGSGAAQAPPVFAILAVVLFAISALLLIPSVLRLVRAARTGIGPARAVVLLAFPAATAVLGAILRVISRDDSIAFVVVFDGVWAFGFVALVAYALVRHRLFNIDVGLRITIRRGTLAAFFVAAFFVASELAQNYFTERLDWLIGTLAAGLLVFLIAPLHHLAERVARATVPDAKPVSSLSHPERVALYREQLSIAWADGTLTHKERRMLDTSRDRLGLSVAEAAGLESAVVRALPRR